MSAWCRHYNGVIGGLLPTWGERRCEADVRYADVKVPAAPDSKTGHDYPCFGESHQGNCPLRSFFTDEERAERDRESAQAVSDFINKLKSDVCPHCDTPITRKRQVGRCVYAEPCGCRLYQGRLTAEEKARYA
jgi:hypothetical protein